VSERGAPLEVVAAVLRDAQGRVLLARRAAGREHAGLWEFPGGKREPGESARDALARELVEELGVRLRDACPLWRVPWPGDHRDLVLDAWEVVFDGTPVAHEHEALVWAHPRDLHRQPMPPADRPIAAALRLPRLCSITLDDDDPAVVEASALRAILRGVPMVQLRAPRIAADALRDIATRLLPSARRAGALLLANGAPALVVDPGLDGVQLSAAHWRAHGRPELPPGALVGVSCHDAAELERARDGGADFVLLGPVLPTATHPGRMPLGWQRFASLARASALPVFALGGLAPGDLDLACAEGAFGVAGIRAFG
jgi:8-oxo-dGTP diphosphatase